MSVTEFVASLGATAEQVAESLKKYGIRGRRCDSSDCPLMQAILRHCPQAAAPGLELYSKGRGTYPPVYYLAYADPQVLAPVLSPAAAEFARRFDLDYAWPELEMIDGEESEDEAGEGTS